MLSRLALLKTQYIYIYIYIYIIYIYIYIYIYIILWPHGALHCIVAIVSAKTPNLAKSLA